MQLIIQFLSHISCTSSTQELVATMPGSADLERSVIVASLLPSSRGLSRGERQPIQAEGAVGSQGSRGTEKQRTKQGQPGEREALRQELRLINSVLPTALSPPCGPSDERWGFSGPGKHESRFPCH